jgi:hypothetical protein
MPAKKTAKTKSSSKKPGSKDTPPTTRKRPAGKAASAKGSAKKASTGKKKPSESTSTSKLATTEFAAGAGVDFQAMVESVAAARSFSAKRPAKPSKPAIKERVIPVIDKEAARNKAPKAKRVALLSGDSAIHLENDLRIGSARREALSIDYTIISTDYQGGISVSTADAEEAKTLGDVVKLVHARANGK